ncbi:MAG: metallophosphoesterase [Bdellovibrionales bacterium]|nr:metallophosphoesterase [Bdellovibrionales bacterium]
MNAKCHAAIITVALSLGCQTSNIRNSQAHGGNGIEGELPQNLDLGTPRDFKIAFIGDQGVRQDSKDVLALIKSEGANAVLHQGDFDYNDNANDWMNQINQYLGDATTIPYLVSSGNHDQSALNNYQAKYVERLNQYNASKPDEQKVYCTGEALVDQSCIFGGIYMIFSGIGSIGGSSQKQEHLDYLRQSLSSTVARDSVWKICSWHKNQHLMQVGGKSDETGWEVYEACRDDGAIIATGHEHSYSRTHLLSNMENQTVASTSSVLDISSGKTFAFVSGLGGQGIRDQEVFTTDHFASIYTSNQGAKSGALFCTFNADGIPNKAICKFINIDHEVIDEFTIISKNGAGHSVTRANALAKRVALGTRSPFRNPPNIEVKTKLIPFERVGETTEGGDHDNERQ